MFLSRYVISKKSIILKIDPSTGTVLKRFKQPPDWEWDPDCSKARWERYRWKDFLLFDYNDKLVFQEGKNRFELDESYSCILSRVNNLFILFELFERENCVYKFTYRNPQTRFWSILSALAMSDDWWDWDTPFEDVKKYLDKYKTNKS